MGIKKTKRHVTVRRTHSKKHISIPDKHWMKGLSLLFRNGSTQATSAES